MVDIMVIDQALTREQLLRAQDKMRSMGIRCHLSHMPEESISINCQTQNKEILWCDKKRAQIFYKDTFYGKFTPRELTILETLTSKPHIVFSRGTLVSKLNTNHSNDTPIHNHIKSIRSKLDKISTQLRNSIETIYGSGYKFNPDKLLK